jgi:hypothetical protein
MQTKSVSATGEEWSHTTVRIPKQLHDMAIESRISMSRELRIALEKKVQEKGDAQGPNATNTEAQAFLSNTQDEVDV